MSWLDDVVKTAAGLLPWWQGILLVLAFALLAVLVKKAGPGVVAALVKLHEVEPAETTLNADGSHKDGTGAPAMPVGEDGTIHLPQKPPEDNL